MAHAVGTAAGLERAVAQVLDLASVLAPAIWKEARGKRRAGELKSGWGERGGQSTWLIEEDEKGRRGGYQLPLPPPFFLTLLGAWSTKPDLPKNLGILCSWKAGSASG